MRTPLIVGNWKMHKTVDEAVQYVKDLCSLVKDINDVNVVIAPTFIALHETAKATRNNKVRIAAQDLYWEVEGAFTGEVSGAMIHGSGAQYVIIGHSERRAMFAETDTHIRKKVAAALTHSLTPIVCIGETLDQRESGNTFDILDHQIAINLAEIKTDQLGQIVIAYEPVWAIGTGKNATPMQAAEAHKHIRSRLASTFGKEAAAQCHIIYGGSVKPKNIQELIAQSDVDGALVGGASLEVQAFFEIISRSRKATV